LKTKTKVLILAAVVVVNVSCIDIERPQFTAYKEIDLTRDIYEKNLLGSWSHSFEEEPMQGDIDIYRPTESGEFPPAWFRRRYVFSEDRSCEWLVLHPADAHYMASGSWDVDHRDKTAILVYDADGVVVENVSFRVVELTADILRIKSISN
jgi:hypothetical protein